MTVSAETSATAPNFLIIGAAKAATTSLSSLLAQHPDAAIAREKEPHFFSYEQHYKQGWESYQKLFSHCANRTAIGEASTSYSRIRYHPEVLQRIRQHLPDVKIIYMVRHPLERMESAYIELMATAGHQIFQSVSDAVCKLPMIVDSSRYWEVFNAYRQYFPENHILIVWFEEYIQDRNRVYQDVCRFLGIDDSYVPDLHAAYIHSRHDNLQRINESGHGLITTDTSWDPVTRHRVIDAIRDDNLAFLHYFGKPADYWGDLFS